MIPKPLHKATKDLLSLEKKVFEQQPYDSDEALHDEADRLDVEFESVTAGQRAEAFKLYGCEKAFSRQRRVVEAAPVQRKTVLQKFW